MEVTANVRQAVEESMNGMEVCKYSRLGHRHARGRFLDLDVILTKQQPAVVTLHPLRHLMLAKETCVITNMAVRNTAGAPSRSRARIH